MLAFLDKKKTFHLQIFALQPDVRATERIFQGVKADNESVRFSIHNNLDQLR